MNDKYITVTQLTGYIKYKIDNDINLQDVYLKGEISNFKAHTRGHYYFTLKDDETRINALMFSSSASRLKFIPQDGMKVLVRGKISVYPQTGSYQIYVSEMLEDGLGNLYIAFEQLKAKLESEGLFKKEHKKEIPKFPKTIGIITAPTGAAIRDILSTIKRRYPISNTILFPALVQGREAAPSIVKQISIANTYPIDVLIVGRGGGSIEDLWAFNEEIVARAIYNSEVPVISAVGHEIDFTIADFVADLRAPTPTGAAELAVPDKNDVLKYIDSLDNRLINSINNNINTKREKLKALKTSYILKNPMSMYEIKEQIFDNLYERLINSIKIITSNKETKYNHIMDNNIFTNPSIILDKKINKLDLLINKLEPLNPLNTIKRGYSITRINKKPISSIKNVKINDIMEVEVIDGIIKSKVIE